MITEIDRARAAAWVDGEGCIRIQRHRRKEAAGFVPGRSFSLQVTVGNNDARIIDWFQARWPGGRSQAVHAGQVHRTWALTGGSAVVFLREVQPYLIIKGEQASCALNYAAYVARCAGSPKRRLLSLEDIATCSEFQRELSCLKTAFYEPATVVAV